MKKRFLNRDRILYFVVMILSVLFLYVGNRIAVQDNSYFQSSRADTYYRAEVIAVGNPSRSKIPTTAGVSPISNRTSPSGCGKGRSGARK